MGGGPCPTRLTQAGDVFLVEFERPHTDRQKMGVGHSTGYQGTDGDQRGEDVKSKAPRAPAGAFEALTGDSGGGGFQGRVPLETTLVSPQHFEKDGQRALCWGISGATLVCRGTKL